MVNDPLYNHSVFGPEKGKGGRIGKSDEKLIADLISIHNAENWLGLDEDGLGPVQPGSIIGQNIQLREPEGTCVCGNEGIFRVSRGVGNIIIKGAF